MSHLAKIQTKSGDSLADMYDVVGSIAGLELLDTGEVKTVHEMGQVLFSERVSGRIRRLEAGDTLQSVDFDAVITNLAGPPFRIWKIAVFVDVTARVARCAVMARDPINGQEIPLWRWDETNDEIIRMQDDGGALANLIFLTPDAAWTPPPITMYGDSQPFQVGQISIRGSTAAFGAGTVNPIALIFTAHPTSNVQGSESRGVALPGW